MSEEVSIHHLGIRMMFLLLGVFVAYHCVLLSASYHSLQI